MDDVFLKLVNLSISASWLILAVLVLRVVLKKAPKWVMPLLWGVVALRLVCLFSIESALSLIPSAETIPSEIVTETREPVLYEQACEGRWQGTPPTTCGWRRLGRTSTTRCCPPGSPAWPGSC